MRRGERTPPPAYRGHLPFQGRLCSGFRRRGHLFAPRAPFIRRSKKSRWRKPSAFLGSSCLVPTSHVRGGSVSRRGLNQLARNRTTSQAEPPPKNRPTQTPAALRERGVWGERRFSQRSGLSPQRPIPPSHHFTTAFNLMVRSAARRIFRASPMRKGKTQLRRLTQRPVPVRIMYQIVPKR